MSDPTTPPNASAPRIILTASLSPTTLSLAQATTTSPPMLLHLCARLTDSSTPITILLPGSALSQNIQSFHSSYYSLTCVETDHRPRQMEVHGLLSPCVTIKDASSELLTLYPDASSATITIQIGIHASSRYQERKEEGADTLPYLAIAATPLVGLEPGRTYEVGLKDVAGEFPAYVWWWDYGEKEEVVGKRVGKGGLGEKVFDVPVVDFSGRICLEMVGKPVLKVE